MAVFIFLFSARNFSNRQRTALGQRGLKNSILRFPAPGGPVDQHANCLKIAQFRGQTLGTDGFFPQKCPYFREIAVFLFSAWNFSYCPRGRPTRPKGPQNPVFCGFPPLGVRSAKTQNVKKLRNFGEKLLGRTDFPPKSAPSSGKLRRSVFRPAP